MECPHCRSEIDAKPHFFALGADKSGAWKVSNLRCPTCDRLVINLCSEQGATHPVLPQAACRARLSSDVPDEWAQDYDAACRVLPHSPEASAALSRRLLHKLLSVKTGAGHGGLSEQIRQAVVSSDLPPYLKQALQTLSRLAALEPDSAKSTRPEALAPVTSGEAEWLLDVLLAMLDLYFVQPAKMGRRQAELEQLVASAATQPAESADEPASAAKVASDGSAPVAGGDSSGGAGVVDPKSGVSGSASI